MSTEPPIVPEGKHALDNLTAGELGHGSRMIDTDLAAAAQTGHVATWEARAIVAWLWAKRTDPNAQLDAWRKLDGVDLLETLRFVQAPKTPDQLEADREAADADPTGHSSELA